MHGLRPTAILDYETESQLPSHWLPSDADRDGVTDDRDRCPNTPAGAVVDAHGCPKDTDGDGVYDDSSGSDSHNLSLSKACAGSVRDYLVSRGVDASRLVARGYGETRPVADNATAAGRARNRRVELTRID